MQNDNEKKLYSMDDITSVASLEEAMKNNIGDVQCLYDKAIKFNVINEQFFINWQDELNRLSQIPPEESN